MDNGNGTMIISTQSIAADIARENELNSKLGKCNTTFTNIPCHLILIYNFTPAVVDGCVQIKCG